MKKIFIAIVLLAVCSAQAQTADNKQKLKQLNQNIVSAYQNQKFDDALEFAQQALNLSLRAFSENGDETATAYKVVGTIYREKGKYKNSLENLQKALVIYGRDPAANGKNLFEIYNLFALSQSLGGMKKEAEASYSKAIETGEKVFGPDAKENLKPLSALAIFYQQSNDDEKSREYFLKSYALAAKYFGKDSKEVESLKIYEAYYSRRVIFAGDDKQYDEYSKKKAELLGAPSATVVNLPAPAYSDAARAQRKQGRIVVKVSVDERGRATDARAVYGEMFFASSVEESARSAKYKPAADATGKSIASIVYIRYNFVNSN